MRFSWFLALVISLNPCFVVAAESSAPNVIVHEKHQPLPVIEFKDAKGKIFSLTDFKGYPVLLHFWASWCAPCVEELPGLDRMAEITGGKRGFTVIPISFDTDAGVVEEFYKKYNIKHLPVYISAKPSLLSQLKLKGLPASLTVSPDTEEVARINGKMDWDDYHSLVGIAMWVEGHEPPTPWLPGEK